MIFTKEWELKRAIRNYKRKELNKNEKKQNKKWKILIFLLIVILIWYLHMQGYSKKSLINATIISIIMSLFSLIYYNIKLKKEFILYEKSQATREFRIVQQIEDKREQNRNIITQIILKNDEGYDVKTWKIGKANSLVIGKNSRIKVDIDLTNCNFSQLISKNHALLNQSENGWYIEDLNSVNGTGIEKQIDNRKIKVKDTPVKVQSGDTIYISKTALLLK